MAQPGTPAALSDRRWVILSVVAVAQLMVVLDATIVNIALPSAQRALGFPDSDRQWVVTAYALTMGSLVAGLLLLAEFRAWSATSPVSARYRFALVRGIPAPDSQDHPGRSSIDHPAGPGRFQ